MSITDELREFASHCAGGMGGDALRDQKPRYCPNCGRKVVDG